MDEIDAQDCRNEIRDASITAHFAKLASEMPKGEPGVCKHCENQSLRLVKGFCAPCRDLLKRK